MKTHHATVANRYKKYLSAWNAVAAVSAAFKISLENGKETMPPLSGPQTPVAATLSKSKTAIVFDDEVALKPKYTQEFKIKVKSIRIDKSLPKIFID